MSKFLRIVKNFSIGVIIGLLILILSKAFMIEQIYLSRYNEAHETLMREQQRINTVNNIVLANHALRVQMESMRVAWQDEMATRKELAKNYQELQLSYLLFMHTLEKIDEEALERVTEVLNE